MRNLIIGFLVLMFHTVAVADTINVPADQPTIQAGIDAAVNGDTVLVAPGMYVENIRFNGKAITVKSDVDGDPCTHDISPETSIIDGGNPVNPKYGSVVSFFNGEGPDSVLEGFTLVNGTGTLIEGVRCGGGICFLNASSPIITSIKVVGNSADSGGGICCNSSPSPIITNTKITGNSAGVWGGGICCYDDSLTVTNTEIAKNTAHFVGGGVCFTGLSSATFSNTTIVGNTVEMTGGGIYCAGEANSPTLTNSILWDNGAVSGSEIYIDNSLGGYTTFTINYSDVKGGLASVHVDQGSTLNWGSDMIEADPLFVNPANHDFHLTFKSPCKDSGDAATATELIDFEGDPRIAYGKVDMGADEFHPHLYYTGVASPGNVIDMVLIGMPQQPTYIFLGSDILASPRQTKFGLWHLIPPYETLHLGNIPWCGCIKVHQRIPPNCPVPLELPMQGLVRKLTNLEVLEVK